MSNVVFSTWNGQLIDHRATPDQAPEPKSAGLPVKFGPDQTPEVILGWGGVVLYNPEVNVVDAAIHYLEGIQAHSCGQCLPCPVGTRVMLDIFNDIAAGKGQADDLVRLERLCHRVNTGSLCSFGQKAPVPIQHLITHFRDDLELAITQGRDRDGTLASHSTQMAPCTAECPAHTDVALYVERIKHGDFQGSLELIRETDCLPGTLGRACYAPCESACRRENVDRAINIRLLKRFVFDNELRFGLQHRVKVQPAPDANKLPAVAVIGAGPAGLACAFNLAERGIKVTVFETLPKGGGMVKVGIPDYRVPAEVLQYEIDELERIGVTIEYNQRLGRDFTLTDIKGRGFGAVAVAIGAHLSKKMGLEGEDDNIPGYTTAVDYLRDVNLEVDLDLGKRVMVVGAGNVAMDCVRSARRSGAEVFLIYRRGKKDMPAHEHEVHDAEDEGVQFHFYTHPIKILTHPDGRLRGLEMVKMELVDDGTGRKRPTPVEGSNFEMEGDAVVGAIGQDPDMTWIGEEDNLVLNKWDNIEVDRFTRQSLDNPFVFCIGDAQTGPENLILAIGNGNRSAVYIEQYIREGRCTVEEYDRLEKVIRELKPYDKQEQVPLPGGLERFNSTWVPAAERVIDFRECEVGLNQEEALAEANRCMRCMQAITVVTRNP